MDEHDVMRVIKGYQHRIDDQREVFAPFVAALINSQPMRGKKAKPVKPTDLFDRKKREKQQKAANLNGRREGHVERVERPRPMPMPKGLQDMLSAMKGGDPQ